MVERLTPTIEESLISVPISHLYMRQFVTKMSEEASEIQIHLSDAVYIQHESIFTPTDSDPTSRPSLLACSQALMIQDRMTDAGTTASRSMPSPLVI